MAGDSERAGVVHRALEVASGVTPASDAEVQRLMGALDDLIAGRGRGAARAATARDALESWRDTRTIKLP